VVSLPLLHQTAARHTTMTKKNIPFALSQTVQTIVPGIETTLWFHGAAHFHFEADGNFEIEIATIAGPTTKGFAIISIPDFQGQREASGPMLMFLSRCRIAAHEAALLYGVLDPERSDLSKPVMRAEMSEI